MKIFLPFAIILVFLSQSARREDLISSLDVGIEGSRSFMESDTELLYRNSQDSILYGRNATLESSLFLDFNRLITARIGATYHSQGGRE